MSSLNIRDAEQIADNELKRYPKYGFVIKPEIKEYQFGWVFEYTTRKYLETGDFMDIPPGAGYLIVNRDGEVFSPGTSIPLDEVIDEYIKEWRLSHPQ